MMTIAQIALGGALGAVCRHLVGRASVHLLGMGFPYGVLAVNVVGSLLMGLAFIWLAERELLRLAPFVMVGVLGGFTTFSAFSLDVLLLYERGELGLAALYIVASVALSVGALWAGITLGRAAWA